MGEILSFVSVAIVQMALPFWLIRRDDRRLSPERWARGFPPATFWIAIVYFGPLAILLHYVRTRRSLAGLAMGIAWLAVTLAISVLIGVGIEHFVGIIRPTRL